MPRSESPFNELFAQLSPKEQEQYRSDFLTFGRAGLKISATGKVRLATMEEMMGVDPDELARAEYKRTNKMPSKKEIEEAAEL